MRLCFLVAVAMGAIGGSSAVSSQDAGARISVDAGVFTTEQARWGEERYRAMCARCHGRDLRALYAEVPGLASYAFAVNWPGRTVGDLYETIRYTMPMVARQTQPRGRTDQKEFISGELAIGLAAYILSFNGYPAGETELQPDPERLHLIDITPPPNAP